MMYPPVPPEFAKKCEAQGLVWDPYTEAYRPREWLAGRNPTKTNSSDILGSEALEKSTLHTPDKIYQATSTAELLSSLNITQYRSNGFELDPEQIATLQMYFANRKMLLAAPTGFGKTEIASIITAHALTSNKRILFLTVDSKLSHQFAGKLKERIADDSEVEKKIAFVSEIDTHKREKVYHSSDKSVYITTPSTFLNDLLAKRVGWNNFESVIIDESHEAVGNHSLNILASLMQSESVSRLVMSATPSKSSYAMQSVASNFGCNVVRISKSSRQSQYSENIETAHLSGKMLKCARYLYCAAHDVAPRLVKSIRDCSRSDFDFQQCGTMFSKLQRETDNSKTRTPLQILRASRRQVFADLASLTAFNNGELELKCDATMPQFQRDVRELAGKIQLAIEAQVTELIQSCVGPNNEFVIPATGTWQSIRSTLDMLGKLSRACGMRSTLGAVYSQALVLNEIYHLYQTITTVGQYSFLEYALGKYREAYEMKLAGKYTNYLGDVYLAMGQVRSALREIASGTPYQQLLDWSTKPKIETINEETAHSFRELCSTVLTSRGAAKFGEGAKFLIDRKESDHPREEGDINWINNFIDPGKSEQALMIVGEVRAAQFLAARLSRLTNRRVAWIAGSSGMRASESKSVMKKMRAKEIDVLIGTSTLDYGTDLPAVKLLLNSDPMVKPHRRLQRAGRVGRAGVPGIVVDRVTNGCRDQKRAHLGQRSLDKLKRELYGEVKERKVKRRASIRPNQFEKVPNFPIPADQLFDEPITEGSSFGQLFALPLPFGGAQSKAMSFAPRWPKITSRNVKISQEDIYYVANRYSVSENMAHMLITKGFKSDQDFCEYLYPNLEEHLRGDRPKDMLQAVCEIREAIVAQRRILIAGDFDADGICAAVILARAIRQAGGIVEVVSPCRLDEGFGLNARIVKSALSSRNTLLITADFGSQNKRHFNELRSIPTIVVDHHNFGDEHPGSTYFVNPHRKDCGFEKSHLCASGLAWVCAYELIGEKAYELLPYAALGTIADVVPLVGLNRALTLRGLSELDKTRHAGLLALLKAIGINGGDCQSQDVAFKLGPILNASGRMCRMGASDLHELLLTEDANVATQKAREAIARNEERKSEELVQRRVALKQVHNSEESDAIVLSHPDMTPGMAGLVASKLTERFGVPSAVFAPHLKGGENNADDIFLRGSIRSIEGCDIAEILNTCKGSTERAGGHAMAGGGTVRASKMRQFKDEFTLEVSRRMAGISNTQNCKVDFEITLDDLVNRQNAICEELARLEPFGQNNLRPVFYLRGVEVRDASIVKPGHLSVRFGRDDKELLGYMWHTVDHPALVSDMSLDSAYDFPRGVSIKPAIPQDKMLVDLAVEISQLHVGVGEGARRKIMITIKAAQLSSECLIGNDIIRWC